MKIFNDTMFWIILIIVFFAITVIVAVVKAAIYKQYGVPVYSTYPMYPVRL